MTLSNPSLTPVLHTSSSRPPLAVTAARARAIETLSPCFLPAAANLGQEQAAAAALEGGQGREHGDNRLHGRGNRAVGCLARDAIPLVQHLPGIPHVVNARGAPRSPLASTNA